MKKNFDLTVFILLFTSIISFTVIASFFYNLYNHYEEFNLVLNKNKNFKTLEALAQIGDFFSGHINGFVLIILIISLLLQRKSLNRFKESIEHQILANKTIKKDLEENIKTNTRQIQEFITSNMFEEFSREEKKILEIEVELNLKKFFDNNFNEYLEIDIRRLDELIQRVNYIKKFLQEDLHEKLIDKYSIILKTRYSENRVQNLKKLLIANKLQELYEKFLEFESNILYKEIKINRVNFIYLFLLDYMKSNNLNIEENKLIIALLSKSFFEIRFNNKKNSLYKFVKNSSSIDKYYELCVRLNI